MDPTTSEICGDCKGTGIYVGFVATETCKLCGGTGKGSTPGGHHKRLSAACPIIGPDLLKIRATPVYAKFNFRQILLSLPMASIHWVYAFDKPPYGSLNQHIQWDPSYVTESSALLSAKRDKRVYALYRISNGNEQPALRDAVYELVWSR